MNIEVERLFQDTQNLLLESLRGRQTWKKPTNEHLRAHSAEGEWLYNLTDWDDIFDGEHRDSPAHVLFYVGMYRTIWTMDDSLVERAAQMGHAYALRMMGDYKAAAERHNAGALYRVGNTFLAAQLGWEEAILDIIYSAPIEDQCSLVYALRPTSLSRRLLGLFERVRGCYRYIFLMYHYMTGVIIFDFPQWVINDYNDTRAQCKRKCMALIIGAPALNRDVRLVIARKMWRDLFDPKK